MFQVYDQELRQVLSAEKAATLRAASAQAPRRAPVRVRLGESLVSLGLRLTAECAPSTARTA
jgi:hypothetical protein